MARLLLLLTIGCLALGACAAEPDRAFCEPGLACAGATEGSCAHGVEAARHGRNKFANGTCVASDDATCAAASVTCAVWGQCHAPQPGYHPAPCSAPDDRDLAASRDPRCTDGTCLAIADDCKRARVCALEGRCTAKDGVCVADAASCKASELCKSLGACTLVGTQCLASSLGECQTSSNCADLGQCALSKGRCVHCSKSPECIQEGLCHPVAKRCSAVIPKHCAESKACKVGGRCRLFQGACVK